MNEQLHHALLNKEPDIMSGSLFYCLMHIQFSAGITVIYINVINQIKIIKISKC